jgi:transcriptional regulator with XRE-family HTH domain
MKQAFPTRSILGLTQDDMAQLLGIGRSQWSMFESGKRDLPTSAKLLLAEITHSLQRQGLVNKRTELPSHHTEMEQYVAKLLCCNKFKRLSIERKLDSANKKQQANLAVLQVARMLTDKPVRKSASWLELVNRLSAKASRIEVKGVMAVLRYEFQLQLLESERQLLEESQKKYKMIKQSI